LPAFQVNNRSTRQAKLRLEEGRQTQGEPRPGPLGGDRRSVRIEAQAALIKALLEATPDITTEGCARRWSSVGTPSATEPCSGSSAVTHWRARKSGQPTEQDRPDVLKRQKEWFDGQIDLDLERLVFIAETSAH
jgi:hypothetical protein